MAPKRKIISSDGNENRKRLEVIPWMGIKPMTFQLAGQCPTYLATPVRAQYLFHFEWLNSLLSEVIFRTLSLKIKRPITLTMFLPVCVCVWGRGDSIREEKEEKKWSTRLSYKQKNENVWKPLPNRNRFFLSLFMQCFSIPFFLIE